MNRKILAVVALLATIATICYVANNESSNNLRAWKAFVNMQSDSPRGVARHWLHDNYRVLQVLRFVFYVTTAGHSTLDARTFKDQWAPVYEQFGGSEQDLDNDAKDFLGECSSNDASGTCTFNSAFWGHAAESVRQQLLQGLQGAPADLDDPMADDATTMNLSVKKIRMLERVTKMTVRFAVSQKFQKQIKFAEEEANAEEEDDFAQQAAEHVLQRVLSRPEAFTQCGLAVWHFVKGSPGQTLHFNELYNFMHDLHVLDGQDFSDESRADAKDDYQNDVVANGFNTEATFKAALPQLYSQAHEEAEEAGLLEE